MTQPDQAFERLQHANPYTVTEIERLSGEQFLTVVDTPALEPVRVSHRRPLLAFAAALLLVLVTLPILLYGTRKQGPPATEAPSDFAPDTPPLIDDIHLEGEYRVDQLGTPFTFTATSGWGHTVANDGSVTFVDPDHLGNLTFIRATGLSNPDDPFTTLANEFWPIDDIEGWLSRLDSQIAVTNRTTIILDGTDVLRFDLTVADGAPCISSSACGAFVTNRQIDNVTINSGVSHRVWWIEEGEFQPIVVVAGGDAAFIEGALVMVNTMRFGPVQPHPIPEGNTWELGFTVEVPPGTVRLPALGGVQFDLPQQRQVEQGADHVRLDVSTFAGVDIAYVVSGPGGSIKTIADVVTQLTDLGISLTKVEVPEGALPDGQAFDLVRGEAVGPRVLFANNLAGGDDRRNWSVPATGRLWLFETERGVLMVSATTTEDTFSLDEAITLAEQIVPTLILIDGGDLPR